MEGIQSRVQDAITKMVDSLDKEHFRKMQRDMYQCSARCCDNKEYNLTELQSCVDRCSRPLNQSQEMMQHELTRFQDRLQRCAMSCQDSLRDRVGPSSKDTDVARYRGDMEKCVVKCGEEHIALVPEMMKRIQEVLKAQASS